MREEKRAGVDDVAPRLADAPDHGKARKTPARASSGSAATSVAI